MGSQRIGCDWDVAYISFLSIHLSMDLYIASISCFLQFHLKCHWQPLCVNIPIYPVNRCWIFGFCINSVVNKGTEDLVKSFPGTAGPWINLVFAEVSLNKGKCHEPHGIFLVRDDKHTHTHNTHTHTCW